MQISTAFLSLLALAPSTIALAVPQPETVGEDYSNGTATQLEKRSHYAWVGSFDDSNTNCAGKPLPGPRPKVKNSDCVKFTPSTSRVGIYWGQVRLSSLFQIVSFKM